MLLQLYPLAEQASRILTYLSASPSALSETDVGLSARVGLVSAQHVAVVRRTLLDTGLAAQTGFKFNLTATSERLKHLATNLEGIAAYLKIHKDHDTVQLVITEPGEKSALRRAIDDRHALSPLVFQTRDAFISLAHLAIRELIVVAPFIDNQGADFLIELFSLCRPEVQRHLIVRPLCEPQCGDAFRSRSADFWKLNLSVYEYALPSTLPSGRETFHAKIILADDAAFYVGSSNFMGSALDRSLECGVIVRGESARELYCVVNSLRSIATKISCE